MPRRMRRVLMPTATPRAGPALGTALRGVFPPSSPSRFRTLNGSLCPEADPHNTVRGGEGWQPLLPEPERYSEAADQLQIELRR